MSDNDELDKVMREVLSKTRTDVFDLAIEICKDLAKTGGCAMCCALAIERAKKGVEDRIAKANTKPVLELVKGTH